MTDALIVGAGPTGLTLACELLSRGLSVRVIEKSKERTKQSRALALQSRTLEIFEKMGVLPEMLEHGIPIKQLNLYHDAKTLVKLSFSHLKCPYPFVLSLPQEETERILSHRFEQLGGNIERGSTLKDLYDATAIIENDEGEEQSSFRWIFGCDGAHSVVRHALQLPFEGAEFFETFALADVYAKSTVSHEEGHIFFHGGEMVAALPLPEKDAFRLITILSPDEDKSLPVIDYFRERIKTCCHLPFEITESYWESLFTVHRRIVPKMRVNNTFLVGDAAHIHSPAGGQGLNTSVQDAYNLGWKIALVHNGLAHESLLDTYQTERHPIAKQVLKGTTLATKMIASSLFRSLLPFIAPFLNSDFFQKRILWNLSELKFCYPTKESEPSCKGPKCGQRAPDVPHLLANHRLFDFFNHPYYTLLCFDSDPLEGRFENVIRVVKASEIDTSSALKMAYGVSSACYFLIRPDGYIAYRSTSPDPDPFLNYLSKIFL